MVRSKELQVEGIDINESYLKSCQNKIDQQQMNDYISVREFSVYDLIEQERYDAVYFSASFMLLPDQRKALTTIKPCLKDQGYVCFTQTFETKRTRFWEIVKPLLYLFTTVHFGMVTYQEPFLKMLEEEGFDVEINEVLKVQGPREMRAILAKKQS